MIEPGLLAEIIRKHRDEAGLSRIQLADMAGVGKTVVYDIEHGKPSVRLDTLRKILDVLNIKVRLESPVMERLINYENEKSQDIGKGE